MIEFSLQKKTLTGIGTISEPLIPVTIIGPSRSVDLFMLLDSGADISLLPYSVGEIIGLPLSMDKRREICGIGEGSVSYILSTVTLKIGDYTVPLRIGWVMIEEVPLIIGRLDFFMSFSIEFREFENRIVLKHVSEKSQNKIPDNS